MRVIAGTARSLPLKTHYGYDNRPTTDRIKDTLFNIMNPYIPASEFLDLFAGSGQIGIEALSRGAAHACFVEQNKQALGCIEDNLKFTKFQEKSRLIRGDVFGFLNSLKEIPYDVIFLDPPYGEQIEKRILTMLSGKRFQNETLIVCEALIDEDFSYVERLGFTHIKTKEYKTNKHIFLLADPSGSAQKA